ncbi:MAG TPA: pilus assembly PilX N-terminal domain-containing protein [Dehalococcoidia bacterium]
MKSLIRMLKKEAGQALPLALILVFLGTAVVVPSLYLSTTSLRATRVVDQKTLEAYAADAGINDALWHLQAEERLALINPFDIWPVEYNLSEDLGREEVNDKDVTVNIDRAWVLGGLPDVPATMQEADDMNANLQYAVMGSINNVNHTNYIVNISTNETASEVHLDHIGIWLPGGYEYEPDSVTINGVAIGGTGDPLHLVKNPDDPQTPLRGGTALIWDYSGETFQNLSSITPPSPGGGWTPAQRYPPSIRLSFDYHNNPVVTPFREAEAFFPWIKLTIPYKIAWDTEIRFFHVASTATTPETDSHTIVDAYVPAGVTRYAPGSGSGEGAAIGGDYITIGNSLMTACWYRTGSWWNYVYHVGPPCDYTATNNEKGKLFTQSSATINPDAVPTNAQIEMAYLYWTAWWKTNGADTQATLSVNGAPVGTDGTVTADTWYVLPPPGLSGYQYACFANVTDAVKAITTTVDGTVFTVGGVSAVPATKPDGSTENQLANAGWSMVIIYSSPDVEVHQIYLYDQLAYLYSGQAVFTITGFLAPEVGTRDAKVGAFVAEGDPLRLPDYFEFKGQQFTNYVYLGDLSTSAPNPYNNIFNSYSSATGFTPSTLYGQPEGKIAGVDLESFTQDRNGNPLSNIVLPNDTSANIRVNSSNTQNNADAVMVVYIIFSVRSNTPPAGQGFQVGTMMYQFR